eukprot:c24384_g1_i2 orf=370-1194(-)
MEASSKPLPPPASIDNASLQLLQVHVLFRHGDRSPLPRHDANAATIQLWESRLQEIPSGFPRREYHFQQHPFGQITKKGARQSIEFGEWLRKLYVDSGWLSLKDPSSCIQARSTNFCRAHLTGWFVLEGLLGSSAAAATVPIYIREESDENLLHNNERCPRLAKLWKDAWNNMMDPVPLPDRTWKETRWITEFKELKGKLSRHVGVDLNSATQLSWLLAFDTIRCGWFHGDSLPEGVTGEQLNQVQSILAQVYTNTFYLVLAFNGLNGHLTCLL